MRKLLTGCLTIGLLMLTACGARQDPTPTLMPPLPTAGPSPTPTSVAVVLTPITVTGEARATTAPTAAPTVAVPLTYDPAVSGSVAPDEVLFVRGEYSTERLPLQLWAVGRDGSNARLVTIYTPAAGEFAFELSPDGRFAAVSDVPGGVLIDLQAGSKSVLLEMTDPAAWVGQFAWTPDSKTVYYAAHDTAAGSVTVYQHTVDPMGAPVALQGNLTLDGLALYPHRVLPDGRLVLTAASTESYRDAAVYDPAGGTVVPLNTAGLGDVLILDARGDSEVLFQPISAGDLVSANPLYIGIINAAGQIEGAYQVTDAGYGRASFLPDGGFGAISLLDPLLSQLVIFPEPAGQLVQGSVAQFPADNDYETGFVVLDANTLLVTRTQPPELWIYPLDEGVPFELVNLVE